MSVTLCCGCKFEEYPEDAVDLYIKDHYIDYDAEVTRRAYSYGCYCKKCAEEYESWEVVLHNESEIQLWLSGEMEE